MERLLDVAQVDELVDLAVGVAGDVDQRAVLRGLLVQAVDRDDREELVDRPESGIDWKTEKLGTYLSREHLLEVLELLRDLLEGLQIAVDPFADLPEEDLALERSSSER